MQLLGEEAYGDIAGLAILKDKEEAHTHTRIEHLAPHTQSRQHVKTLLEGQSISSFDGKIFIEPSAQLSNAYQLNNQCLLSKDARCYSKPNLEILADDVKASHGCTVSRLEDENVFYLRSRGLSAKATKALLLQAFCHEILEKGSFGDRAYNIINNYFL